MRALRPLSICPHLKGEDPDYHIWFTGHGRECHWVCNECDKLFPALPTGMSSVDDATWEGYDGESYEEGIRGTPEIKERPSSLAFSHRSVTIPALEAQAWLDLQPDLQSDGSWLVLLASGTVAKLDSATGRLEEVFPLADAGFTPDADTALIVAPAGDYAAIYQVSSSLACVFDLRSGAITTRVSRGDYRPQNSCYPIAFFNSPDDGTLLVAATAWNRLDIIDPADGRLLTPREVGPSTKEQPIPEHYSHYFHAGLLVSPDHNWISDHGWYWAPVGKVHCWNLRDWLHKNAWESDEGESLHEITYTLYFWDGAQVWTGDRTLAIWGWGRDEEFHIPAVVLFDAESGEERGWFPGPEARKVPAYPPNKKQPPSLFFDGFLFSSNGISGTSVWDIEDGARLLHDPDFNPIHYHPGSKEFLSISGETLTLSRLVK